MASSLISSSHHIDFDSVFGMEDASLAPVFESLITTGLKEFLGCPAIFYEAALTEFFANGSVRDGVVVSTIGGTAAVEISESVFAAMFELPSEGLTDLSDVPKNIVFDAWRLFSDSKEQEEQLYIVESTVSSSPMPQRQESSSSSSDSQMHFDSNDFPLDDTTEAQTSLPAATVDLSSLLDDLKSSLSQLMDDANSEILSRLHTAERSLQTSLGHQNDYLRSLIQSARQEGQIKDDVQILRLNELKKAVIAQGVSADTESLAIRNKFNALDAKILLLDGQVAAIRSEQLEFQAKISADLLSLSTQIGDLVDYIRGGDAKKGEGSSSCPQPPPSNVQGEGSGPSVVRLTDIADRIREDDRRQMAAERERERQRWIRWLSSGSHKRRRGHL
ncbi:basal body protein [Dorcoceras hygrometricum]|uniref:Basal body protein n=1 Tax=Dorcoceras hygrometricum TaxID=472368 RepID=A0A2Z7C331_9LAMI|nr:basal body protein [Dorcoceras hygrometricum]